MQKVETKQRPREHRMSEGMHQVGNRTESAAVNGSDVVSEIASINAGRENKRIRDRDGASTSEQRQCACFRAQRHSLPHISRGVEPVVGVLCLSSSKSFSPKNWRVLLMK
jgi:hypothetical protein